MHAACAAALSVILLHANAAQADDFLIPLDAVWSYQTGNNDIPRDWRKRDFDDSGWETGQAGFGYGDSDDVTVLRDMRGNYREVYIRREFELSEIPENLFLYIDFDDAFIAYLNGREITRSNVDIRRNVSSREAGKTNIYRLRTRHALPGRNVLAIVGLNSSLDSSDFSLRPALADSGILLNVLSRERAQRDIATLIDRIKMQSSYWRVRSDRNPVAFLEQLSAQMPERVGRKTLYRFLARAIGSINDSHAAIDADDLFGDEKHYMPFSLAESREGIVAVNASKKEFVDKDFPFVVAIDGIEIETWIAAASVYTGNGSPQIVRRRALRQIRDLGFLRADLKRPASETFEVTFSNINDAQQTKQFSLEDRRPRTAEVVLGKSRILDGSIGYLHIPEMDNDLIPGIHEEMDAFRATDGLIIDVRNNGGGRLGITQALAPYFYPPDHSPLVVNIAAYRLAPIFDEDHLFNRPTLPLSHEDWTAEERSVIEQAMTTFEPEWQFPEEEFSAWHYMLINRDSDRVDTHYHYDRPVVVLSNARSFSATDGFLNAAHLFPNTIVMGQPSGGGSGRRRSFDLFESNIEISLSSMASFRPNGKLFDGNGIEVDVEVEPAAEDFVGKGDRALAAALEYLNASADRQ